MEQQFVFTAENNFYKLCIFFICLFSSFYIHNPAGADSSYFGFFLL